MKASTDASTYEDISSSHIGLTSSVLPEAKKPNLGKRSQTGVSTRNVPLRTANQKKIPHWFALRTTYGREKKAYEYIISRNGTAFYPTIITQKIFFVYSALLNGEHQNHITISKNICALPHKFLQDHHLAACVYPRQMDCLDNAPIHHATNSCNIVAILFFSYIFTNNFHIL